MSGPSLVKLPGVTDAYPTKHRKPPNHNSMEKIPHWARINLIYQGVSGGGVNLFMPMPSWTYCESALKPWWWRVAGPARDLNLYGRVAEEELRWQGLHPYQ